MENTKRDLSLDFTKPRQPRGGLSGPSLMTPTIYNISTPDISTPDLNKLISDGELAVLTPNGISSIIPQQTTILPSPLIPTTVNSNNIINTNNNNNNHNNNNNTTTTNNNNNSTNGNQNGHCVNKNYNSNTSNNLQNSNKCNGLNGNQQNQSSHKKRSDKSREVDVERIEKKRERNRLAAKKCRQRKLETIDELRKTVSEWEQKYQRLEMTFEDFKKIRSREIEALMRENAELKQNSNSIARRS